MSPDSLAFVMGIDPGGFRKRATSAWAALALDNASGQVTVKHRAVHFPRVALEDVLRAESLLFDPRLRLAAIAGPMTTSFLDRKPVRPRSIEIRLSRGAFSSSARGPNMPWISCARTTWPHYQENRNLQVLLAERGLPLLSMPAEEQAIELPFRCLAEVYPKATLALLSPTAPLLDRPPTKSLFGQLDEWIFTRSFSEGSTPAFLKSSLASLGLALAPDVLAELGRIASLRRPFPRREPIRAFVAAFQGILALRGGACLVGAPGDHEGSVLLPASWHPFWEREWADPRKTVLNVRRITVRGLLHPAHYAPTSMSTCPRPSQPTPLAPARAAR